MALQDLTPDSVRLEGGTELAYVRAGSGPVLILIHGAMGDWRSWAPQWDRFTGQFDCIAYSRRYSYPNANVLNTRNHNALVDAADLEGLMDALGIPQAILVGSSYGGFTALAMAVRAPERVSALAAVEAPMMRYALMDPQRAPVAEAFLEASAYPARAAFERGDNARGVRILTGGIVGSKPADIPAAILERRMQNVQAARSLALSDDEFPLLEPEALASLPMPVLLMTGAQTALVHKAIFEGVCAAIPHARTRVVEGSGHSVSAEAPETFNTEVLEFLAENGFMANRRSA